MHQHDFRELMKNSPMSKDDVVSGDTSQPSPAPRIRRPYAKPVLESLGDFRDLTMAVSMGMGESGMVFTRKDAM